MFKYKSIIYIIVIGVFLPFGFAQAGTILSSYKYAWSDNVGYINFAPANGGVVVTDTALSGSAWSENTGYINFAPVQGGVLNDGAGNLSGSAWGEGVGYIDFDNVSINPTTGEFSGTATGDLVGTLTFDCPNYCDVITDWRPSNASNTSISGSRVGGRIVPTGSALIPATVAVPSVNLKTPTQSKIIPLLPSLGKELVANVISQESNEQNDIISERPKISFLKIIINFFNKVFYYFLRIFK